MTPHSTDHALETDPAHASSSSISSIANGHPPHKSSELEQQAVYILLQLEPQARNAQTVKELQFLAVNNTRQLLPYRQAFVFSAGASARNRCHVETASSLPMIQREAPITQWLERTLHAIRNKHDIPTTQRWTVDDCPPDLKTQWREFSFAHVLWCPFVLSNGTFLGGLWLAKETPWLDSEASVAQRLSDTYAHAWGALCGNKKTARPKTFSRYWWWLALLITLIGLHLPVSMSTLAPMEIVAKDPAVVSAPMDGVIADILVPPNTLVAKGQTAFVYEDTNFRSQYEVAEQNLAKAVAEYRKAAQGAFFEGEDNAQASLLITDVRLNETKRDFALERLEQIEVKAAKSGLLIYSAKSDWIGRPIEVGQRIMDIADPTHIELRIDLPVNDAIVLNEGADIEVFLDARPLETLGATLTRASYQAMPLPDHILAYRVTGTFNDPDPEVRIGWRGTAKIYGDQVSLGFLLFRRPMAFMRQFLGL